MPDQQPQTDQSDAGLPPDAQVGVRFREAPTARFDDLTRGLLWPNLFRGPGLALRPERVGLSLVALVLIGLIGSLAELWSEGGGLADAVGAAVASGTQRTVAGLLALDLPTIIAGGVEAWTAPVAVLADRPVTGAVLGVPMLAVLSIAVGAVSRSAAREYADDTREPWTRSLAFALTRGVSFFFTIAGPGLAVALIALLIAVSGWALLTLPGLSIIGALLFGFTLIAGVLAAIIAVFGVLAMPISGAALACEGTDAIDALQRAYAYAVARPLRLLIYIVIAKLLGLAFLALIGGVLGLGQSITLAASEAFGGQPIADNDTALWNASSAIVEFWLGLLQLLLASVAMSYSICASTLVYLQIRRVVDGQDPHDLWSPTPGGGGA